MRCEIVSHEVSTGSGSDRGPIHVTVDLIIGDPVVTAPVLTS
jgi:hypothetical protein